jgi:hypothetical protein
MLLCGAQLPVRPLTDLHGGARFKCCAAQFALAAWRADSQMCGSKMVRFTNRLRALLRQVHGNERFPSLALLLLCNEQRNLADGVN